MFDSANLRAFSRPRCVRGLGLPLASTAAVIALTSFTAPAKALSFNWQFPNTDASPSTGGVVTGTISGLLDNTSNQTTGLTVTVTSAPNSPSGGWLNNWVYDGSGGSGFTVFNGQVTGGNARFINSSGDNLWLTDGTATSPNLYNAAYTLVNENKGNQLTFTPQQTSAVPGPLPLLGAAAALGWSRRVRSRLRSVKGSAR